MEQYQLKMVNQSKKLLKIPDNKLIHKFEIREKNKIRIVNNPRPELKSILKEWNDIITIYYVELLEKENLSKIAHAYLPNKSIKTNTQAHIYSDIIQFDFKGFYDSCKFEYFIEHLKQLDMSIDNNNAYMIKRLLIDSKTKGITQGLPVSGALAGLSLIPFWKKLRENIPENINFTQYSDDLTFSFTGTQPKEFTIPILKKKIYESLKKCGLNFKLNNDKTRIETGHFRKITGVRINNYNQMTPSRKDYRFLRHALFILSKSDDLDKELEIWGFKSKSSFVGKISYMRSIDDTNKVNNIIMEYRETCRKHNIFTKWIKESYEMSAFA